MRRGLNKPRQGAISILGVSTRYTQYKKNSLHAVRTALTMHMHTTMYTAYCIAEQCIAKKRV